jgi:hypothetical protein
MTLCPAVQHRQGQRMTSNRPRGRSRVAWPLRAIEPAWPLLACASTAVGLVGSARHYGLVGLALIYLASAVFAMVMVYAVFAEDSARVSKVPIVRIGLVSALVLVVMLGLIILMPIAGWVVAAVTAATCPLVTNRLAARGGAIGRSTPATGRIIAPDESLVDRAFLGIVAELENDPSWRHDATPEA